MSTGIQKVLISDPVAPDCLEVFKNVAGFEVDHKPGLKPADLMEIIPAYAGLIVRSETKVTAAVLERATNLRAVVRAGAGVDNIDCDAATRRGVLVMNCPAGNTIAAAELTIALMMSMCRNIPQAHASTKAGKWERSKLSGIEVTGKTLGVLGLGKIGREVARRAIGLGMKVVGYDPFVTADAAKALEIETGSVEDVITRADIVTVHVPMNDETRGLIGKDAIAKIVKKGVRILNVARGGIVDEKALAEAVTSGHVAGAALDVFEKEPVDPTNPLLALDKVVITPHLGASTKEAQETVGRESAEQIIAYLRDGAIQNAVNMAAVDPALVRKVGPWQALCMRLGSLAAQLRDGQIKRITLSYAGDLFGGNERKFLSLALLQGFLRHVTDSSVNFVNAMHFAREHGVDVVEKTSLLTEGYLNLVSVSVDTTGPTGERTRTVAGTIFGEKHPRLVRVDGWTCDALPEGPLFLVSNNDTPGIIGKIGTLMGESKVNIAFMSVGRDTNGGTALAILNVDSPVPAEVARKLEREPGILWTRTVTL